MDWNNDGKKDLLTGDRNGYIYIFINKGTDASPSFSDKGPGYTKLKIGGSDFNCVLNSMPEVVDWDSDGKKDILCGDTFGRVSFLRNTGGDSAPSFSSQVYLKDGGGNLNVSGSASPAAVDWNGDGRKDLLCGGIWGSVAYFENKGTDAAPVFSGGVALQAAGQGINVGYYSRIAVADLNGDGQMDLLVGNDEGEVWHYASTPPPTYPEIDVKGAGLSIPNGDDTPRIEDFTDFGGVDVESGTVARAFKIDNLGDGALNLTGDPKVRIAGPNAGDFGVALQPASPVAPGASAAFEISFDPSAQAERSATVEISNNDTDENPYTFAIKGVGVAFIEADAFASATAISGNLGQALGSNRGATKEPGEPDHAGNAGGASVWFVWTAPAPGQLTLNTDGSDFDTLLAVYTGSQVTSLTPVASNDDAATGVVWSRATFDVSAGTACHVAIDGRDGATGDVVLNWILSPYKATLANISTRGFAGAGGDAMIAGFIIEGPENKQVLVTGWGPSLAQFGTPNVLADPSLTVYSGATPLATNDNWQDAANKDDVIALGLAPSNALESAALLSLAPGAYTAILSGAGGATGNGLVAVWNADAGQAVLTNISTRGRVGLGGDVMIAGVIIDGNVPKKVGVTGWGPSLAQFGTPNVLANPTLTLYQGATPVGTSDDWQTSAFKDAVIEAHLEPSDPLESAIVTTLGPGAYTAILSGAGGATGNGLVAVWDVE